MPRRVVIAVPLVLVLLLSPASAQAKRSSRGKVVPVHLLTTALKQQLAANTILTDPALDANVPAIRVAVLRAAPHVLLAQRALRSALPLVSGPTQQFVRGALGEIKSELALARLILTGPDQFVVVRLEELRVHGGSRWRRSTLPS